MNNIDNTVRSIEPVCINNIFVANDVTSINVFIVQLDIYGAAVLFHLFNGVLCCNNWPFTEVLNKALESDDNIADPMMEVSHSLPLYCKTPPDDKLTSKSTTNGDVKFKGSFIPFHFHILKFGYLVTVKY